MNHRAKLFIHVVGTAFLLGSLIYLGVGVGRHWASLRAIHIVYPGWVLVAIAVYGISHVTTGLAWPFALRALGERISLTEGLRIGLVAQIGKYLPGNVAHYFGRGVLARAAGIPLGMSSLSTAVELVAALGAAVTISTVTALIEPRPLHVLPQLGPSGTVVASVILLAALGFAMWIASRGHGTRLFVLPMICLTISLLLSGFSLAALLRALGYANASVVLVLAAVALAWVAGFLVPGAPAGLGIREAILVAILTGEIGAGAALAGALLHRLITAAVDALVAGGGYVWMSHSVLPKK